MKGKGSWATGGAGTPRCLLSTRGKNVTRRSMKYVLKETSERIMQKGALGGLTHLGEVERRYRIRAPSHLLSQKQALTSRGGSGLLASQD